MLHILIVLSIYWLVLNLLHSIWWIPSPDSSPIPFRRADRWLALFLYTLAHGLTILRLPYALLPYCCKVILFISLPKQHKTIWNNPRVQIIRLCGDFLNFALLTLLFYANIDHSLVKWVIFSEFVRLWAEKGQTIWSGVWQHLPHTKFADCLASYSGHSRMFASYIGYYRMNEQQKLIHIQRSLQVMSKVDWDTANKLHYVTGYELVPSSHNLRGGKVRDLATGRLYIHQSWLNDPWLLIGITLRRSSWIFDTKQSQFPLFYRTQANGMMTIFILKNWRYSPPFACYQFGHEIKAARFNLFFRFCRIVGFDLEQPVDQYGEYHFDPLVTFIQRKITAHQSYHAISDDIA